MKATIRYGSGKARYIGRGTSVDLDQLDATIQEGAVVYSDGDVYYSNGSEWVVPQDTINVSRPQALTPTTATQQTQLRLTPFNSPASATQVGVYFEVSTTKDFTTPVFTRLLSGASISSYQLTYPGDGFQPGDTVWWRARYLGTDAMQSRFSFPFSQVFPEFITTPSPVTAGGASSVDVTVTPYESADVFGLSYYQTETEYYYVGDTPGVSTPVIVVTHTSGAVTPNPISLNPLGTYIWRTRYAGRAGSSPPSVYSAWTAPRSVVVIPTTIQLEYNLDLATARTVYIPLGAGTVNVSVNWGDGNTDTYTTAGIKSHVYAGGVGPVVRVVISGTLSWYGTSAESLNQNGLVKVIGLGHTMGITSLRGAFIGVTSAITFMTPVLPPLATNVSYMFYKAETFNYDIGNWDVSSVTNMSYMFREAVAFNQNIGSWDVSSVTNMSNMFGTTTPLPAIRQAAFNNGGSPSIGNWDVSSVTDMSGMFRQCANFNQNIGSWDVSSVTNMSGMFMGWWSFANMLFNNGGSPSIGNWDVSSVTDMSGMFQHCVAFNQNIGSWDVSSVTNMSGMFYDGKAGPQLNNWDVSSVTNMSSMFAYCRFAPEIGSWDVSSVTNMSDMFFSTVPAFTYNPPIQNWNVSSVSVHGSVSWTGFNRDLSTWNLRKQGITFPVSPYFFARPSSWSTENYSRTLVGWANTIASNDGPHAVSTGFWTDAGYHATVYAPGSRFTNAVAARAFLTGGRAVSVTGASNANANTTYTYVAGTQTYDASNDWYFAVLGTSWALYDDTDTLQATGTGAAPGTGPHTATSWDGILSAATVLRTGAEWTIVDGGLV